MSGDHGAKALDDRLHEVDPRDVFDEGNTYGELILGEHGLFVEDVREHEPQGADTPNMLLCKCGWYRNADGRESYFDHIGTQP